MTMHHILRISLQCCVRRKGTVECTEPDCCNRQGDDLPFGFTSVGRHGHDPCPRGLVSPFDSHWPSRTGSMAAAKRACGQRVYDSCRF